MPQTVVILDFGGQYKELIARRVRENNVFAIVKRGDAILEEITTLCPIGIILTGGPSSVLDDNAPKCDPRIFSLNIPILGICYGLHLMTHTLGGKVKHGKIREYGRTLVTMNDPNLFPANAGFTVMSHTDTVEFLPKGFKSTAYTDDCPNAAISNESLKFYGLQFHPEVENTDGGSEIIRNFLYKICGAKGDYTIEDFETRQIDEIRQKVGDKNVLLALSGGVDSAVCAALLSKAIGRKLFCVFVDHGLMRQDEGDEIEQVFGNKNLQFIRVNAKDEFLWPLKKVVEPEMKRKIIGAKFIEIFEHQAHCLESLYGEMKILAQGTIYPDVIESGGGNNAATIKSHHNVGGLPEHMNFSEIIEPLRTLFKDEVRQLGKQLGLPDKIINRQPFPGPGLAIRIIGEVTEEKLDILRKADFIFRDELEKNGVNASQYFAVLPDLRSVGVMGDERTYHRAVALRAVITGDFMTCQYARVPYDVLDRVSARLVNEIPSVSRVLYDITGKPPATIEWE